MSFLEKLARLRRDVRDDRQVSARRRAAERTLHMQLSERIARLAADPPQGAGARTLVMGLSVNYGPDELRPFIGSLRHHGYAGDVVLLVANTNAETRAFLGGHGVDAVPFDMLPMLAMSMNSARMLRYLDILGERVFAPDGSTSYAHILLTDVRDVVFQGDPFARAAGADIHYFLEEGSRTIGSCAVNANWMRQALGEAGLRRTAASPVSCAGTLIATPQALLAYLLQMCRLILEVPALARYSGVDQAIHNHLMVEGLAGRHPRAVPNGQAVMTVPSDVPHGLTLQPDGTLLNRDGSVSEIVHQYDRDPVLREAVAARWRRG